MTGRRPFSYVMLQELIAQKITDEYSILQPLEDLAVPEQVKGFFQRAMARPVTERFQSIDEFSLAFEEAMQAMELAGFRQAFAGNYMQLPDSADLVKKIPPGTSPPASLPLEQTDDASQRTTRIEHITPQQQAELERAAGAIQVSDEGTAPLAVGVYMDSESKPLQPASVRRMPIIAGIAALLIIAIITAFVFLVQKDSSTLELTSSSHAVGNTQAERVEKKADPARANAPGESIQSVDTSVETAQKNRSLHTPEPPPAVIKRQIEIWPQIAQSDTILDGVEVYINGARIATTSAGKGVAYTFEEGKTYYVELKSPIIKPIPKKAYTLKDIPGTILKVKVEDIL
jgi:hypothetical protein